MLIGYKRGQGSIILRVKILDSTVSTGAGKTGLTSASSGLIIGSIADNEATSTAYTVAGSTIETITTLGTYAAPTATKCRFKEVDSTNHKGIYEIQMDDTRFAVSSAKSLIVSISGATGAAETDVCVPLLDFNPYDAVRGGLTALPNAAADAAGGLPISDAGGLDLDAQVGTKINDILTDTGTTLDGKIDTIDANVDSILVDTAEIGAAGAGLTAVPWNAAWDAEVQSEVDDAIIAKGLDHLLFTSVTGTDIADDSIIAKMVSKSATADWDSFTNTTDSLEGLRDRGDAAWTTATGFSTLDAAGIRTAIGMASADLDTQLATISGYIDTEVAAIKAKTDNLPSDPADASDIAASFVKIKKYLQLIVRKDSFIATDNATELGELNADGGSGAGAFVSTTDSLEAIRDRGDSAWITATGFSTLDAAGVRSAIGLASANLDTQLAAIDDYLDTELAALITTVGVAGAGLSAIPKTGFKLASDGLDSIDITEPTTVAATFTEMVILLYLEKFSKSEYDSGDEDIVLYQTDGTTVICTSPATIVGDLKTRGVAV